MNIYVEYLCSKGFILLWEYVMFLMGLLCVNIIN